MWGDNTVTTVPPQTAIRMQPWMRVTKKSTRMMRTKMTRWTRTNMNADSDVYYKDVKVDGYECYIPLGDGLDDEPMTEPDTPVSDRVTC
jgi:hypothetical protein